ncbi:aldehyde dehydrogenase family protein, partial [Nocardia cyriacigeorgica]
LEGAYLQLRVGSPLEPGVLVGPLIDGKAYAGMTAAIDRALADGGELICGGERVDGFGDNAYYVRPAIIRMPTQTAVVREETFAPILYVLTYHDFDGAVELHNAVPQGLSSSVFTTD